MSSLKLSMSQNVRQSPEQTLAQKLESILELGLMADAILHEVAPPNDFLKGIVKTIINTLPQEKRQMLYVNCDDLFLETVLQYSYLLCMSTPERITSFVNQYVHTLMQGSFTFELHREGDDFKTYTNQVSIGNFMDSMTKAEHMQLELDTIVQEMKDNPHQDLQGNLQRQREIRDALEVREHINPIINSLAVIPAFLCNAKINNCYLLQEFLRDIELRKKFSPIITERLLKRFAHRFKSIRSMSKDSRETALINSLAEYAMICLGVVDGELFQLQRGLVNLDRQEIITEEIAKTDQQLTDLLDHYNLKDSGPIFWNRWKVKGMRATRMTDEKVRDFVTYTVRQDKKSLFAVIPVDALYNNLLSLSGPRHSEERQLAFAQLLQDQALHTTILHLAKTKWYSALDEFYTGFIEKRKAAN